MTATLTALRDENDIIARFEFARREDIPWGFRGFGLVCPPLHNLFAVAVYVRCPGYDLMPARAARDYLLDCDVEVLGAGWLG